MNDPVDPVELAILNAPPDDEPESDEERAEVEAARADPRPDISHEEVRREFGLTDQEGANGSVETRFPHGPTTR